MSIVLGKEGSVRLRRSSSLSWTAVVEPDDINTNLHRLGIDGSLDNVLTGDRVVMQTDDPRGLAFIRPSYWNLGASADTATPYVHINAMGGLRLFSQFTEAINNERDKEVKLTAFAGAPILVNFTIRDTIFNELGLVEGYRFNSDRAAIDTTELGDKFREMYDAGLLSGSGTIDCLFNHSYTDCIRDGVRPPTELPLVMLQLLQRLDVGSGFDAALHITEKKKGSKMSVFYDVHGIITRSGIDVRAQDFTKVAIDFVTTGEYRLLVGDPEGYILKEDDFFISKEKDLGFLLKEETD